MIFTKRRPIGEGARENAASDGGPRDKTDAGIAAVGNHLAFFFAVEQVVEVLHADELGPAMRSGDVLESLELPGVHL